MRVMNFDGLVGPTHNYAGLSHGNVASEKNKASESRPREAVLQGLEKMAFVHALGVPQGILPPLERPHIGTLRRLGFGSGSASGSTAKKEAAVLADVATKTPWILAACSSASAMWTANAATVTASADAADGKVHFTPANLSSKFHRAIEPADTARALQRIFASDAFVHHAPLPGHFGDEGAANHTRLYVDDRGMDLFVWGHALGAPSPTTQYAARQAKQASEAIARLHRCRAPLFIQQSPHAIDTGAFHNDVVSVGEGDLLIAHASAFANETDTDRIARAFEERTGAPLRVRVVREDELSLVDAIGCYLFNSQIVTTAEGLVLIAPTECETHRGAATLIRRWCEDGTLAGAHFLDLRQSMRNGGGPACLRLRAPLTSEERAQVHGGVVFSPERHTALTNWANEHYRETLHADDLADPQLLQESRGALDALTQILELGSDFYAFQRG